MHTPTACVEHLHVRLELGTGKVIHAHPVAASASGWLAALMSPGTRRGRCSRSPGAAAGSDRPRRPGGPSNWAQASSAAGTLVRQRQG